MGVLGATSKPWPMSGPPNPADFPGHNPIPVQATLITNYLREEVNYSEMPVVQRRSPRCSSSPSSGLAGSSRMCSQNEYVSSPCRGQVQQSYRKSMHVTSAPPLYETVRPKSFYAEEELCLKGKDYMPSGHFRQKSEILRPPVPPPLPPNRPSSASSLVHIRQYESYESEVQDPPTANFVRWIRKMKVIKKLKRTIGSMGSSISDSNFNNLPALKYHSVHGENVKIFEEGRLARRIAGFSKAIVFSNRPVKINERVYIRLAEMTTFWQGLVRFGFTKINPINMRNMPDFLCPDFTNLPGCWAKSIPEKIEDRLVQNENNVISFHVTSAGHVRYSINGISQGTFLTGVDTRYPLWAVIDVYGNTTAVELIDPRAPLNNAQPAPPSRASGSSSPACSRTMSTPSGCSPVMARELYAAPPVVSAGARMGTMRAAAHSSSSPVPSTSRMQKQECFEMTSLAKHLPSPGCSEKQQRFASGASQSSSCVQAKASPSYKSLPLSKSSTCVKAQAGPSGSPVVSYEARYERPGTSKDCRSNNVEYVKMASKAIPPSHDYESIYSVKSCIQTPSVSSLSKAEYGACAVSPSKSELPKCASDDSPSKDNSSMILECLVCCERPVDSVFYSCGHMCMCYQCAVGYWRTKEKGHCPICRAAINDVIRTYM